MTSFFTFKEYLENRVSSGIPISKNEALLKEDMDQFVKGDTSRSHVQILKRQLIKFQGPKPLLRNIGQRDFLEKIRTCETRDYVTKLHAKRGRPLEKVAVSFSKETEIPSEKKCFNSEKRKDLCQLSRQGKWKRRENLIKKLDAKDLNLMKSKQEKLNAFETLIYQKEAKMSARDLKKTGKLMKRKTGKNVLAGWRQTKKAKDQAMPEEIVVDDFKAEVTLQNGLNKTAGRFIESKIIDVDQKKVLMAEKNCTLVVKAGQDGTTGIKEINSKEVRLAALILNHVIPQIWCRTRYIFALLHFHSHRRERKQMHTM